MKKSVLWMACVLPLLPAAGSAAAPARSEYQAALRAKPDFEHGSQLFSQCTACHGSEGQGLPDGSAPRIAGQHFRVVVKQLVDFRYGKRWDARMQQRANAHLGAFQDIADVASYLSQLPRGSVGAAPEAGVESRGASLYQEGCASCHGVHGEGNDQEVVPVLAGQHAAYLLRQMQGAVDGQRPALKALHEKRLQQLEAGQLRAIADFLSTLESNH